jgi:hypothetical protein
MRHKKYRIRISNSVGSVLSEFFFACGLHRSGDDDSYEGKKQEVRICKRCEQYKVGADNKTIFDITVSSDFPLDKVKELSSRSQIYELLWNHGIELKVPQRKKWMDRFEEAKSEFRASADIDRVRHIVNEKTGRSFCGRIVDIRYIDTESRNWCDKCLDSCPNAGERIKLYLRIKGE